MRHRRDSAAGRRAWTARAWRDARPSRGASRPAAPARTPTSAAQGSRASRMAPERCGASRAARWALRAPGRPTRAAARDALRRYRRGRPRVPRATHVHGGWGEVLGGAECCSTRCVDRRGRPRVPRVVAALHGRRRAMLGRRRVLLAGARGTAAEPSAPRQPHLHPGRRDLSVQRACWRGGAVCQTPPGSSGAWRRGVPRTAPRARAKLNAARAPAWAESARRRCFASPRARRALGAVTLRRPVLRHPAGRDERACTPTCVWTGELHVRRRVLLGRLRRSRRAW